MAGILVDRIEFHYTDATGLKSDEDFDQTMAFLKRQLLRLAARKGLTLVIDGEVLLDG